MLDAHKIKHRTVEADGVNLFYRKAGRSDAPGVLLLHGQPCSSYSFREVISPLAEVARVVAPDLPGCGFTEAPDDYEYTFEAMARTIDALTQEIGLGGSSSTSTTSVPQSLITWRWRTPTGCWG